MLRYEPIILHIYKAVVQFPLQSTRYIHSPRQVKTDFKGRVEKKEVY